MKLLFDYNPSPRLVDLLSDRYPQSSHVATLGLDTASDHDVWTYAREHGFSIVTKDSDFNDLTVLHGYPPNILAANGELYNTPGGAGIACCSSARIGISC